MVEAVPVAKIGILVDGPYWHNAPLIDQIKKELEKVNDGQFEIRYPAEFTLNGQYDISAIELYARELAESREIDAIVSLGMITSYLFSKMNPLPVPVVALDYILPAGWGMLSAESYQPLNPNWTTSFDPAYVDQTLKIFPKLASGNRFVVLCPQAACGFDPQIRRLIESFIDKPGIQTQLEIISPQNYKQKLAALPNALVVVEALKGFSDSEMQDLYKRLTDRKLLSFTVDGMNGIQKGALISIHDYSVKRLGRNIALKLFDILNGTPPSQIPVVDFKNAELIFNRDTARQIGYDLPLEFIDEARLYGAKDVFPELAFESAIQRALEQNFDIKAQALVKNQSMLQVDIEERSFYPQIFSELNHNRTNKAQADAFGGPRGETRVDLFLEQKLFDKESWKSIQSAQATQQVEQQTLELVNQDIILQVALSYMDNLQEGELVEIQRSYLNLIRKNQTLADLKFKLKETGKSDVLRLNIELENARIDLMDAKEARYRARVRLNNLLNLPRETVHRYTADSFSVEKYQKRADRFSRFLSTREQLEVFRNFFDEQAQVHSPDLKVLSADRNQAQKEKERIQAKFYPTVQAEAQYFNQFQDETQSLSGAQRRVYEDRFSEGWQVQLKLKWPLFQGGSRFKEVDQANARIMEVDSRISGLKNTLSQDARSGLFNVFRSRRNLDFALRTVQSSQENLKLAEVAYLEGDLPVIDLLDSQTRLILSRTNAVRTRYQFHRDLFTVFRSVGKIDLIKKFNHPEELQRFVEEVERYFAQHSGTSSPQNYPVTETK